MGSLSIWHWLIVLLVVVLIFGTKKLRNMGEDLGGAVKGFKKGMDEADDKKVNNPSQLNRTADSGTAEGETSQKDKDFDAR